MTTIEALERAEQDARGSVLHPERARLMESLEDLVSLARDAADLVKRTTESTTKARDRVDAELVAEAQREADDLHALLTRLDERVKLLGEKVADWDSSLAKDVDARLTALTERRRAIAAIADYLRRN